MQLGGRSCESVSPFIRNLRKGNKPESCCCGYLQFPELLFITGLEKTFTVVGHRQNVGMIQIAVSKKIHKLSET